MGREGGNVVSHIETQVKFRCLPEDEWVDLNGFKIVGPVYKMTVERFGDDDHPSVVELTGDRKFFDAVATMMSNVIKGQAQQTISQSTTQVKLATS